MKAAMLGTVTALVAIENEMFDTASMLRLPRFPILLGLRRSHQELDGTGDRHHRLCLTYGVPARPGLPPSSARWDDRHPFPAAASRAHSSLTFVSQVSSPQVRSIHSAAELSPGSASRR